VLTGDTADPHEEIITNPEAGNRALIKINVRTRQETAAPQDFDPAYVC
jgi:hypothetical protein